MGPSAAYVLEQGRECRVAVLKYQNMGITSSLGLPIYAFALTVFPREGDPYQVKVGNPVDPAAVPHLYPGVHLSARVLLEDPHAVVIDFGHAGN